MADLVTEYWIWSNQHRGWWGPNKRGYTNLLQEAGRYAESIAMEIIEHCNFTQKRSEWPNEVMIPVTDAYLFVAGREIYRDFKRTGDRGPLDDAYWKAQDEALMNSHEFQDSLNEMLRGEGRVIRPEEGGDERTDGD